MVPLNYNFIFTRMDMRGANTVLIAKVCHGIQDDVALP